jgi:hypothetical protein
VAATRGSQAALHAALDTLQDQLAAAEAELPGNDATASSARIVSLRDRIHKLNTQVSEIEVRVVWLVCTCCVQRHVDLQGSALEHW